MQRKETMNYDQFETSEQERAQATAKDGRRGYSKKSAKVSSQSRKRGAKAGAGEKQRRGTQQTVYKIAELLPKETIKKLKEMKQ